MKEWFVRLQGRECDLQELPKLFTSAKATVCEEDGAYFLKSTEFESLPTPDAVYAAANRILEVLRDIAKFHLGNCKTVELDCIWEVDEEGHKKGAKVLFGEVGVTARVSMQAAATVAKADGSIDTSQGPTDCDTLLSLAVGQNSISTTLRFLQEPSWVNLYKVYEIISDAVGGQKEIYRKSWATKKDISRFTGTAQSRAALGDEARHASGKYKPPKNPMSTAEARTFVKELFRAWVSSVRRCCSFLMKSLSLSLPWVLYFLFFTTRLAMKFVVG